MFPYAVSFQTLIWVYSQNHKILVVAQNVTMESASVTKDSLTREENVVSLSI